MFAPLHSWWLLLLLPKPAMPGSLDPSFESVAKLYPLLGWSREGLGVADHAAAAVLDKSPEVITGAAHSGQLCSIVYPKHPPACSATQGQCTTEATDLGSAYFVLTLHDGASGNEPERIVLNCSHSSTRSLRGFAPIVEAQPTSAAYQRAAQALVHRNDTDSCAGLANVSGKSWVEYGNGARRSDCTLFGANQLHVPQTVLGSTAT